nr:hypothetical protein [Tanacetum cinerariifolium]
MSNSTFAKTHNLIAFLEKPSESDGFEPIVDFLNANQIKYALTASLTIYTSCIKQFWTTLKIKTVNDDVQLQALIDGKKVAITEASIRHDLKLNDEEGTSCLSNAVIFEELARMGAKTTSWNEFSSTMASAITCLTNNQMSNFSKYILDNLKMNLEAGIYVNPSLTKKVFASMKRVGTGFSRVVTPLFDTMMVQVVEEVGDLPTVVQDTPIPDAPSSSQPQRKHKPRRKEKKERKETEVCPTELPTEEHVPTPSNDPLPSSEDNVTDGDGKEVAEEMVEVITTAKIIVDEVSTTGGELNAANEEPVSVAPIKITTTQQSEATKITVDVKDKGKAKLVEEPEVLKLRKAQIEINKEVARRIEAEWNADMQDNINWNEVVEQVQSLKMNAERTKDPRKRTRKEKVEKDQTAKKKKGDELEKDNADEQKLEEQQEAEELKRNLEIVPDDEDDVFVTIAPLSSKPPTIMDYKIYKEGKNEHF